MLAILISVMMSITMNPTTPEVPLCGGLAEEFSAFQAPAFFMTNYIQPAWGAEAVYGSFDAYAFDEGTRQCSAGLWVLSCSVTCDEGYRARCRLLTGCKCVKLDDDEDGGAPNDEVEIIPT